MGRNTTACAPPPQLRHGGITAAQHRRAWPLFWLELALRTHTNSFAPRKYPPDIVSQVPVHRIGSPYYTRGHPPTPRSFGNFSACWAHSFGGLPETPVIRRDNMSGLKNWAVLGSGHFRYRKLSPPVTSEGRFHPFLTHFLRGEPDSIF